MSDVVIYSDDFRYQEEVGETGFSLIKQIIDVFFFMTFFRWIEDFLDRHQNPVKCGYERVPVEAADDPDTYLERGDVLKRDLCGVLSHTGLYSGKGEVIEISGEKKLNKNKGPKKNKLKDFVEEGEPLYKVTIHDENQRDREEYMALAEEAVENAEGFPKYNCCQNNCQHFVTNLILGQHRALDSTAKKVWNFVGKPLFLLLIGICLHLLANLLTQRYVNHCGHGFLIAIRLGLSFLCKFVCMIKSKETSFAKVAKITAFVVLRVIIFEVVYFIFDCVLACIVDGYVPFNVINSMIRLGKEFYHIQFGLISLYQAHHVCCSCNHG